MFPRPLSTAGSTACQWAKTLWKVLPSLASFSYISCFEFVVGWRAFLWQTSVSQAQNLIFDNTSGILRPRVIGA